MFSRQITTSDAFVDMPSSTQLLYFHLNMEADDDGFVSNPKRMIRMLNVGDDDLKILLAKRFLLPFSNGVVVIKHWLLHNSVRKDMYKETQYLEHKNTLKIKDNNVYTENRNETVTKPLHRLDKVRLDKDSITAFSEKKTGTKLETKTPTMKKNSFGRYNENQPADSFEDVVDMDSGEVIKENKPEIKKAYDTILKWSEERRGFKFLNRIKQYSALKKARTAKIKAVDLRQRWKEMEQEEFYKKIGFDWATVVNSFDRKK